MAMDRSPFARNAVTEAITTIETQDRMFIGALKRVLKISPEDAEKDVINMFLQHWADITDADLQLVQRLFFRLDAHMKWVCGSRDLPTVRSSFSTLDFAPSDIAGELAYDTDFFSKLLAECEAIGLLLHIPEVV